MTELTALATRWGKWWSVEVPQIKGLHTQARRLDQIPAMVLDAAAGLTGRPESDFAVTIVPQLDEEHASLIDAVKLARSSLAEAQATAAATNREVVARLRGEGLTARDIAALLGISPQRAAALAA